MRILYDGWPLVYSPLSAGSWHLRTLLAMKIEGHEAVLALPTEPQPVQPGLQTVFRHTHDRGEWEQRVLPQLAAEHNAAAIHTTGLASLFGKTPTFVSPAERRGEGQRSRAAEAQGFGGLARATVIWPSDLPKSKSGTVRTLSPVTHSDFKPATVHVTVQGMPDEYILVHELPDERATLHLLESWTWAAASIGEFYPLMIVGLNARMQEFVQSQLPKFHVENTVRVAAEIAPQDLPAIYAAASAIVHVGEPAAWGNSLRLALASGKATIAHQEPITEGVVGNAAYLIKPNDLRGFGAAMITCVVDEKAREKLEESAWRRAAQWSSANFANELQEVYTLIK